jgi:PAS domain S-box-containing protein
MDLLRPFGRWNRVGMIAGAGGIAVLFALGYFAVRTPRFIQGPLLSQRTLRIGFENNPPVQIRTDNGLSGLGVEIVSRAAKRAGIKLNWVETGVSSEASFREGLVDLWPLMVELPDRRKYLHFAPPWMHSGNVMLLREGTPYPGRAFKGRIAAFKIPVNFRILHDRFPEAQLVETSTIQDVVKQVCTGASAAGFFEARVAQGELRQKPPECSSVDLRLQTIPDLRLQAGLASTFEAAAAADRIQHEIENMFRDGTLAVLIAKYSYFGLDDTWASYERIESERRWEWLTWAGCGLLLAIGVTLWLAGSLRQRKRVEAALRESEKRFRNLANSAPVMIVGSGPDGRASFFNKTWLDFTGRTSEQELGYGWIDNVHPEDRSRTRAGYTSSFDARGNCNLEYRLRRTDGEYRYVMCSGVPHFEPNGVFAGYIASCIDLTDIRKAQEETRERQNLESLGVLAGGIAHDFNNLLGGTLAYSELAQAKVDEGTSPDDELTQIGKMAIRGSEIVRQLMIFAGSERGDIELVDVSSLVSEMLELLKVSISKHASLKTSLGQGLPAVRINSAQLRQVVMNLITNASEALGDQDGVIHVLTERATPGSVSEMLAAKNLPEGEYLRLEVSDTGCGMTPETQSKAFDPFFTTKFAGRGMGLAMVQRIVRQLGGAIHIVSSIGHGASVQILLPCVAEAPRASDGGGALRMRPVEMKRPTAGAILIVEDEVSLLSAVSKVLQRKGFSVIQASDGCSALEAIRGYEDRISAMLLDVTLPGASSREVFEEAKRLRPGMAAILMSAYSRERATASFAGFTVEYFIRKPFGIDSLMALLRDALAAHSAVEQIPPSPQHLAR